MKAKIMLVEDDLLQRKAIAMLLENRLGFPTVQASDGREALDLLDAAPSSDIRLVILDLHMPKMGGMEVLEIIRQRYPHLPVIMLTGDQDIKTAVKAMKSGACDFLSKPPEPERLQASIHNALKLSTLEKEVSRLKRQEEGVFTFDNIVGHDHGLAGVIKIGRKAAAADIPVLLTGGTGVGKEVFARAIHGESLRVGKPFVTINCGAIPEQLVESALFGHEKGAFTGAVMKSIGRFREADGGTVFLDEIGELPLDAQVKLLRVLQQKEISPVGANHAIRVNVRIIAATNRNLEEEVAAGRFRDDLYFRLNVLQIKVPSLHDRKEDIPELARHFIERFAASESRSLKNIAPDVLEVLMRMSWPGNVRELENAIHRAMIFSEKDTLNMEDFGFMQAALVPMKDGIAYKLENCITLVDSNGHLRTLEDVERAVIEFGLKYSKNNITHTASALGVAPSTFYRKLKQFKDAENKAMISENDRRHS